MPTSPTQRTLKKWREAGYRAEVVEKRVPFNNITQDLFGILDVVAVGNGETVGIQTTSASNTSARVKKITDSEALYDLRKSGWRVVVEGWGKRANGRIYCKEIDVS